MTFDFESARAHVREHLLPLLPPALAYHGPAHTLDQVEPTVWTLCQELDIDGHTSGLIATAALFHDLGFIHRYPDNEKIGAELAARELPAFGYDSEEIALIQRLIMATRMPQTPDCLEAEILCDADLVSLGQEIFLETSMMLRREVITFTGPVPLREWIIQQFEFLSRHHYFTAPARARFEPEKQRNREELYSLLHPHSEDHE